MLPVTLDFPPQDTEEIARIDVAPYVGGGLAIATGDDETNLGVFGSAGVDAFLTPQFAAVAGINVGIVKELEVGLLIGGSFTF